MGRLRVRTVTDADLPQLDALFAEQGFKTRTPEGWAWLRRAPTGLEGVAHGWVIFDEDDTVHGYLGNHPRTATLDGTPVKVAVSADWVVREHARGQSMTLLRRFFKQRWADVFVSTTANPNSGPAYAQYRAVPAAGPDFHTRRIWVADSGALTEPVLERLGLGQLPGLAPLAGTLGRTTLDPIRSRLAHLAGKVPTRVDSVQVARRIDLRNGELSAPLDAHYDRVAALPGLHIRRTAAELHWLLSDPDGASKARMFVARGGKGQIVATLVAARHRAPAHPVSQMRILDITWTPGSMHHVPDLVGAALLHARRSGCALLVLPPGGGRVHASVRGIGGVKQHISHTAHYLRARRGLDSRSIADRWHATALDGDSPLCLEDHTTHN